MREAEQKQMSTTLVEALRPFAERFTKRFLEIGDAAFDEAHSLEEYEAAAAALPLAEAQAQQLANAQSTISKRADIVANALGSLGAIAESDWNGNLCRSIAAIAIEDIHKLAIGDNITPRSKLEEQIEQQAQRIAELEHIVKSLTGPVGIDMRVIQSAEENARLEAERDQLKERVQELETQRDAMLGKKDAVHIGAQAAVSAIKQLEQKSKRIRVLVQALRKFHSPAHDKSLCSGPGNCPYCHADAVLKESGHE